MSKPRPNLFIIGAMKSGTTSLHSYLDNHPQIFMSKPKEPTFFSRESNLAKGEDWYLELFANAGEASIIGESSTEYTKVPDDAVPQRIAKFNPESRFIYIMRDPIERTISHYWLMVRSQGERRDILTAIKRDSHYQDVSHYAMQLAPYFKIFGRDRVACLTLEKLKANTSDVLKNLFSWIGVDSSQSFRISEMKKNVTPQYIKKDKGLAFISAFSRSRYWQAIRPYIPRSLRSIGSGFSKEEIDRTATSTADVAEFLRPIQLEQTKTLSEMLEVQFSEWTTLFNKTSSSDHFSN
jgi:hypothetical protein